MRKQSFSDHFSSMLLQFSCSPLELGVENQGGGDQEDHQDCHHHQQWSAGRVGHWQTLAGVDSVILVTSHALFLKLRSTPALTECLVPHLSTGDLIAKFLLG